MPNKVKRNSDVVDMLANVSVHRGSLLKSIENLLKTIESSESAVMIPTLLRDKCEFDAWELLFVAKILKASILGHVDLVEFYMNHIGLSASQFAQQANQPTQVPTPTSNGHQHSPHPQQAQAQTPTQTQVILSSALPTTSQLASGGSSVPISSLTASSLSSLTPSSSAGNRNQQHNNKPESVSWSGSLSVSSDSSNSSSGSSSSSSCCSSSGNQQPSSSSSPNSASYASLTSSSIPVLEANSQRDSTKAELVESNGDSASTGKAAVLSAALNQRQAQPPSLLQLTTTNNHINSLTNIDQLSSQLSAALQTQASNSVVTSAANGSNGYPLAALSISTGPTANPVGNSESLQNLQQQQQLILQQKAVPELRTSRSAGCLFRLNSSGASSPHTPIQTPTTPYPQAETLAKGLQGGLHGDPSAPVKLLLQIEQLKSSIGHVTSLLESVVELYKESIDNIALA